MPSIALPVSLRGQLLSGSKFSPYSLFTFGTQGIWLDPSDVANLTWRRNLLTYSEQFDNVAWTKSNATVAANNAVAPDGTMSAELLYPASSGNYRHVRADSYNPWVGTYTFSVYAKAAGIRYLVTVDTDATGVGVGFDLQAGTYNLTGNSASDGTTASITPVGDGWYRCVYTSLNAYAYLIFSDTIGAAAVTASGTNGIYLWGAQLELGSVATDYQRISDVNTEVIERFPTATMYQDAAGTTAVTTPGQPVGLRLDKSKGLVLGADVVVNGDFSGGTTGWIAGTGWVVADGQATFTATGANSALSNFPVPVGVLGSLYKIQYTVVSNTLNSGGLLRIGGFSGGSYFASTSNLSSNVGTNTIYLFANGPVRTALDFWVSASATSGSITLDNISVRELPGNHATQSVLASRPVYGIEPAGGRRNLLTWSEGFEVTTAGWIKLNTTVNPDSTTAPNGATTADLLLETAATDYHEVYPTTAVTLVAGQDYALSVFCKSHTSDRFLNLSGSFAISSKAFSVRFDPATNTLSSVYVEGGAVTNATASAEAVENGFYRVQIKFTAVVGSTLLAVQPALSNTMSAPASSSFGLHSYAGNITKGIYLWGAQLELGSTATPYQRVTTAFDVTEAGVQTCHYVQYDGSDDGMITNSIDFTATDKMSVFAGVRKLSDAATGVIVEYSPHTSLNNGSFLLFGRDTFSGAFYEFGSVGTALGLALSNNSAFAAPISNVLTGLSDISGDRATLRINGAQVAQATTDQGTGNYGNYPLYLGRRGGTGLPFNGRDYGIVVVGKATTAAEITSTESWLAGKTGFYAPVITGVPTIGVS